MKFRSNYALQTSNSLLQLLQLTRFAFVVVWQRKTLLLVVLLNNEHVQERFSADAVNHLKVFMTSFSTLLRTTTELLLAKHSMAKACLCTTFVTFRYCDSSQEAILTKFNASHSRFLGI